mgnify:CR=1 FL=1
MSFSNRLKAVIKSSGLKRDEFAEKSGKSRGQLFKYLGGENTPTADFFEAIKAAFPWVNIEWLITGIGEMEVAPRGSVNQSVGKGSSGNIQMAHGNGVVQVGGRINGAVIGGGNKGRLVVNDDNPESKYTSQHMVPLDQVLTVLADYVAPKIIKDIEQRLKNND